FQIALLRSIHPLFFFFSSRRRHTRSTRDWSSDVCSSDLRPFSRLSLPFLLSVSVSPAAGTTKFAAPKGRYLCHGPSKHFYSNERSEERRVGKESRVRGEWRQGKQERASIRNGTE